MSEAEKTPEVEDVLSSIRRLVADRPHDVSDRPQPIAVDVQAPVSVQEPDFEAQENTDEKLQEPVSFVDAINASIAEISENPEEEPRFEAEARSAHVEAFLATETENPSEITDVPEPAAQKLEPFILHAEMAADMAQEPEPEIALEQPLLVEQDDAQAEYVEAARNIPEDTDEFLQFEDIKDDEVEQEFAIETSSDTIVEFSDEDALRNIVSELVRAELQGDLGDRITRNVRKLVRREIHHALATRDFE